MLPARLLALEEFRGVALPWRDHASEARERLRRQLWPTGQAAIAAALAWWIAHDALGHAQPFFAPIAAAISLSTNNIRRGRRILQMLVGVMLGIGVGEVVARAAGSSVGAIGLVVLLTFAAALLIGAGVLSEGMMFANQGAAAAILIVALHKHGTGPERLVDALVGGGVAAVIGVGLFPAHPLAVLRNAERQVLRSLAGALMRVAEMLEGGIRPDPEWTIAAAQDIHRQLANVGQARMTARATARIAPRRWRLRSAVAVEDGRLRALDLLANASLSLFRVATDALEAGEQLPTELPSSINELAGALQVLARSPAPWAAETVADVRRRADATLSSLAPRAAARAPLVASLVRATARDLLGVLPP